MSEPIFFCSRSDDDIIHEIWKSCGADFPLVNCDFDSSPTGYLRSCRRIVDAMDLEAILGWLTPDRIATVEKKVKDRLPQYLHRVISRRDALQPTEKEQLSLLPVFKKLIPDNVDGGLYR